MKQNIFHLLAIAMAVLIIQCSNPVSVPPDIPIETLLASPDTLHIENRNIILTTYLWRDFQPISPPEGKPLITLVQIETPDSSDLPLSMNPDAVYVVYGNQLWKSFFSTEERPSEESKPFRITKIAREGPKWGPNVYVDVIVRITRGDKVYLLRASEQYIGKTI